MAMAEVTVKEEPMDYEFIAPSETNESNGDTPQSKKRCSAVLQTTNNEINQPYSLSEQMTFKQEMVGEPSELMQKEKSASNSCYDDAETSDNENNDPEVFNILEEVEITIDDIKIEADNWTNEPSTPESGKREEQFDHLTKGEIDSSKNKFADKNDVCNTPEDLDISMKVCNKENVMTDSRTDTLLSKSSPFFCSVSGCLSSRLGNPSVGFFEFPVHNIVLCKQWIRYCNNEPLYLLKKGILGQRVVCEKHFTEDSFESIIRRVLSEDAVPTEASSLPAEGDTGLTKEAVPTKASCSPAEGDTGLTKEAIPTKASCLPAEGDTGLTKEAVPTKASCSPPEGGTGLTKEAVPTKASCSPAEGDTGLTKEAVPTKASCSTAEGDTGLTKEAVPTKASCSPAEGGTGLTKEAVPTKASCSPAEGDTGLTKEAVPTKASCSPAVGGTGRTKEAVPTKASCSPAEGDTGLTKEAVPTKASCSPAEGGTGLTKEAVQTKASCSPAEGDTGLTKEAVPTKASCSPAEGDTGLTKEAVPTKASCSPAEGGTGLTKEAVPTKASCSPAVGGTGLTKEAVPTKASCSPAEGGTGLTKEAVPTKARCSPAVGGTGLTKEAVPTKASCAPAVGGTWLSKGAVPTKVSSGDTCDPMTLSRLYFESSEPTRKVYILGLDYDTTEETLQTFFERWGDIVHLFVKRDPLTKRSRGYGFVTFAHLETVRKLMSHRPHKIDGREVIIERANPKCVKKKVKSKIKSKVKSKVKNQLKSQSEAKALSKTKLIHYKKCSFMGCQSSTGDHSLQFFWFPIHSKELRKKWILNCGDKALLNMKEYVLSQNQVCEKHFTKDSFKITRGRILKKDSVPSKPLFDDSSPSQEHADGLNTLSNWPQSLTAGLKLVPRDGVLEPKREMYEFWERVGKQKEEVAEPEDREKLKEENENVQIKKPTQTQSCTHTLLDDVMISCDPPEVGSEIIDLTSRDEKEENENVQIKKPTQTQSSTHTLLHDDVMYSCDLPEDGSEIIDLTSRDQKGKNENEHTLLFDDVLNSWCLPKDNSEMSDLTSQVKDGSSPGILAMGGAESTLNLNQQVYHIGEFVYAEPTERRQEPVLLNIQRLWAGPGNQPMLYGIQYYRPRETLHVAYRTFHEQEVFMTNRRVAIPLNQLCGRCCVLSVKDYIRYRPDNFDEKDIYMCDYWYSTKARVFKKIKNWPERLTVGYKLVPRDKMLDPKRVVFAEICERVEKRKEEVAEPEEGEKLVEEEKLDEENENVQIKKPTQTQSSTHTLLHDDVMYSCDLPEDGSEIIDLTSRDKKGKNENEHSLLFDDVLNSWCLPKDNSEMSDLTSQVKDGSSQGILAMGGAESTLNFNQQVYHIGEFVYAKPTERGQEPVLLNIQRLWAGPGNQPMLYGIQYYRPRETLHVAYRTFHEQEVFMTNRRVAIPLNQVLGRCCVLSVKDYIRYRPDNFDEKDIYMCDYWYSTKARVFKKIKNWPERLTVGYKLVPRDKMLDPKRGMFDEICERVEKRKEEVAEPEEGEKLVEEEKRKGENESVQTKKQKTQSSTHTLLFDDVLKLWGLPEDNEITDFTSQDEEKELDTSQQSFPHKDESEGGTVTCSSNFPTLEFKTPVRTYKRTAPKRHRPASWGEAENEEGKQGKITKSETLLKSHSGKERNGVDLPNCNGNEEINVEVKTSITAPPISIPKGQNLETSIDSTLAASISANVSVNLVYKLHSCFYCNQLMSEIKQHLVEKHIYEEEVKMINKLKSNKLREKEFIFLTRVGDFKHNSRVLDEGSGLLIGLGGRFHDISTFDKDTFVSCPNCAGFVHIHSLQHHHNSCLFKDITLPMSEERNIFVESHAMLAFLKKQKFSNLTHYFSMRLKSIFGTIAKKDELIMLFIPYLYSNKKCQDSSAVLVLLQRLGFILQLYRRIVDNQNIKFHQILKPECVELLLKALQSFFSEVKETDRPGLCKSFYSHISVSAFIWRGKCLMDGNLKSAMGALQFFYHFTNMYKKKLNADLVNRTEVDSGIGHSESISLSPADIITLKSSLNERVEQLTNALCDRVLSNNTVKSVWHDLAEATMCLISLTNPVDFVAIEGIKLTEYAVRPDNAVDDLTKYKSMIPYRMVLEKHIFVCTKHLDSEIVITLSPTVKKAIDVLIKRRREASIHVTHPNIFSGCHDRAMSAMNSFYNICIKQKGVFPEVVVRDLKKRRIISHIIDISEMSQDEVETIKDYLKSSNDHKSSLQISPEDFYKSEIEKEFREALHTYEFNLGSNNNLTREIKLLAPLDTVKYDKRKNEITRNNGVEDGSTQYECEEIDSSPGTKEKKDACEYSLCLSVY